MTNGVRIALDAMGGDFGPSVVVPGAAIARDRRPDTSYLFFGDEKQIRPLLEQHPKLAAVSEIRHTDVVVKSDDKPSQAVRAGRRGSSMWLAIEAVKKGEADAAVSAGNTGALMALSKICLHMLPGIERPALAAIWPTLRGESIVLDVGATIGADAEHLFDLAIMGSAMARIFFDIDRPTVGLLNVGTEEIKGLEEVKAASRRLREANIPTIDYRGFVEGDDLGKGTVDVVVTEGFTGNIALKTAEGTAKQIAQYMRDAFRSSLLSKIGALLARGAFQALKQKIDPRRVNGGLFLGLDGVIIKSHGSMDSVGFAGAIEVGYDMARHKLLDKIRETITLSSEAEASALPPPADDATRG
ncbi:MAG TPA: phosphate acyltransferase PlsX [Beijerinckiaceae bacterium]|nr:phosphate acyltransferase PlsX [Rhodoblastus sp.]MCB9999352.1 phosphate acyltransferase PlsX [Methylobacteriaceae bacterium]HRY04087.1 phosphate acyltransferase PlsX [Beijerinckiaceae bacterium]MCB1537066.1 phosphate acyltransferase PlsX [Rhodoblastus sp.]MCO5088041.1 phosphate acyltransferase PlsX [Methylobacteriaceae bacterium]